MILFVDGEVEDVYVGLGRVDPRRRTVSAKRIQIYEQFVDTVNRRIRQP